MCCLRRRRNGASLQTAGGPPACEPTGDRPRALHGSRLDRGRDPQMDDVPASDGLTPPPALHESDGVFLARGIVNFFETIFRKEVPWNRMKKRDNASYRRASRVSSGNHRGHCGSAGRIFLVVRPQQRGAGSRRRHHHIGSCFAGRRDRDSIGAAGSSGCAADGACLRTVHHRRPRNTLKISITA